MLQMSLRDAFRYEHHLKIELVTGLEAMSSICSSLHRLDVMDFDAYESQLQARLGSLLAKFPNLRSLLTSVIPDIPFIRSLSLLPHLRLLELYQDPICDGEIISPLLTRLDGIPTRGQVTTQNESV